MMDAPDNTLPAYLTGRERHDLDALLAGFARRLADQGVRVRGLVQERRPGKHGCEFSLVDLGNGMRHSISQSLGRHAESCRLDPGQLSAAGSALRRAASEGADLVIFSRFGGQEASGEGFRDEMLAVMSRGIPSLTIVPEPYLSAWLAFTGGAALALEANEDALSAWFRSLSGTETGAAG